MSDYQRIIDLGKAKFGMSTKFKNKSFFMKLLGGILFFNPKFMTNYVTTVGSTVYFPSEEWLKENEDMAATILAHEYVHILDSLDSGSTVFSYLYLLPQVLALLSLLSIFGSLLWLLCLLFLLPIPSPTRTYFEMRGYAMSDAVHKKMTGDFLSIDFLSKQFLTGAYYFMWPFKSSVLAMIEKNRNNIISGEFEKNSDYKEILSCFQSN